MRLHGELLDFSFYSFQFRHLLVMQIRIFVRFLPAIKSTSYTILTASFTDVISQYNQAAIFKNTSTAFKTLGIGVF